MGEKRDMFHFVVRKRHNASRDICTADYTEAEMILDRLETLEPLTPSEEALVKFIEEHASEVARLPIAEIAQRTSTSNATIVRFCRRLGLDGFRAFRLQLVAELERGATAMRTMDPDYPVSPDQSTAASLDMIANLTKEAVDGARAAMDAHDIQAVAHAIHKAPLVLLYATGDSQISSEAFANLLIKIGIRCVIAESRGEFIANCHAARPGEVAMFISYSGDHITSMTKLGVPQELKSRGCTTIAITASTVHQPWIAQTIRFPAREKAFDKMATFYSQACIRFIFNCIYAEVWRLDYDANIHHKHSIDGKAKSVHGA